MNKLAVVSILALIMLSPAPLAFLGGNGVKEVTGTIVKVTDEGLVLSTASGKIELFCKGLWIVFYNKTRFRASWSKIKEKLSEGMEVSAKYIERKIKDKELNIAVTLKIGNYTLVRARVLKKYIKRKAVVKAEGTVEEVGSDYVVVNINGTSVRLETKGAWIVRGSWSSITSSPLSAGDKVLVVYLKLKDRNIALGFKNYDKNVIIVRKRPRGK